MNNPYVLDLFTQLVVFQGDSTQNQMSFANSDHSKQDVLHSLARKLGFEYALRLKEVTISKTSGLNQYTSVRLPELDTLHWIRLLHARVGLLKLVLTR